MPRAAPRAFPAWTEAPRALLARPNPCGLLSAWAVLRHFGRRVSPADLARRCRHSPRHGVYAIWLACALAEHGCAVELFSQPDPAPRPIELSGYRRAASLRIRLRGPIDAAALAARVTARRMAIVLYASPDGGAHLSPMLGLSGNRCQLPGDDRGSIEAGAFERSRNAPGILGQALLVTRAEARGERLRRPARGAGGAARSPSPPARSAA